MRLTNLSLVTGLAASASFEAALATADFSEESPAPLENANHVFNALHSSMRQWGSSLSHNGMSFFLASVPEGTQFYHGRSSNESVKGMEWLAFEPEHALVFARPHAPMEKRDAKAKDDSAGGYLHTYRTKHNLSLLYIDGMSAGKTQKGTLDSTDAILLGVDIEEHNRHMWDFERGQALCNLTRDEWGNRVDGFLRMEMGFEIILCDFEKHLDVERVTQTAGRRSDDRGPPRGGFGDMTYYRAVASRFDGIGGNRVSVNYDDFVTAFTYDTDLFNGELLPRLLNVSNETLSLMHDDVTQLVMSRPSPAYGKIQPTTNWQAVADLVVERYSDRIQYLASFSDLEMLQREADQALKPYIDYGIRNSAAEIERCAAQHLPASSLESLSTAPVAAQAIHAVTSSICNTLVSLSNATDVDSARSSVQDLMSYLQWTTWKRCRGCGAEEVCFIPIWPAGRKQDYENPQCQSSLPSSHDDSYWGGWGPGPRPPKDGEGRIQEEKYPAPPPYGPYPPPPYAIISRTLTATALHRLMATAFPLPMATFHLHLTATIFPCLMVSALLPLMVSALRRLLEAMLHLLTGSITVECGDRQEKTVNGLAWSSRIGSEKKARFNHYLHIYAGSLLPTSVFTFIRSLSPSTTSGGAPLATLIPDRRSLKMDMSSSMSGMAMSTMASSMDMASSMTMAMSSTGTAAAASATSTMDMSSMDSMDMGGDCQVSMLWNWYTIDACFLTESWHITSKGMFAGSCIGVILMVMLLEFLRRAAKEYDRLLLRQHQRAMFAEVSSSGSSSPQRTPVPAPAPAPEPAPVSCCDNTDSIESEKNESSKPSAAAITTTARTAPFPRRTTTRFRPNVMQQAIRALLHLLQFALAYFVMLLAMYYNGYLIICIFIGAFLGAFIFSWESVEVAVASGMGVEEDPTVCCG
ncbi:hypothetical protein UCDDS831_g06534 [Diplodia seriata]|uniref:Copper transporter n=1 Tax=Diplodia seriata TaxID=420778 RepID=A0A0G2E2T9_9PEZI|nr:hypothetical protein UCDDS831_g06534 [Diplodia seriata]